MMRLAGLKRRGKPIPKVLSALTDMLEL
jgi:hypothetical protein